MLIEVPVIEWERFDKDVPERLDEDGEPLGKWTAVLHDEAFNSASVVHVAPHNPYDEKAHNVKASTDLTLAGGIKLRVALPFDEVIRKVNIQLDRTISVDVSGSTVEVDLGTVSLEKVELWPVEIQTNRPLDIRGNVEVAGNIHTESGY